VNGLNRHYQKVVPGTSNRPISTAVSLSVVGHLVLFGALALWLGLKFERAISSRPLVIHLQTRETDGDLSAKAKLDNTVESAEPASAQKPIDEEKTTDTETKLVNLDDDITSDQRSTARQVKETRTTPAEIRLVDLDLNTTTTAEISQEQAPAVNQPQASNLDQAASGSDQQEQAAAVDTEFAEFNSDVSDPENTQVSTGPAEHAESALDGPEIVATVEASEQIVPPGRKASELSTVDSGLAAAKNVSMSPRQERMLDKKFEKWAASLHQMEQSEQSLAWEHQGQQYTAKIKRLPANDNMDIEQIIVEVRTEENGSTMSTEMRMKRLAFSNFTQFVSRWDPRVHVHDDELDGRFHSNSQINLMATREVSPTFHGKVTTASRRVNMGESHRRARRDDVFLGGLETGVRRIVMPKHFVPFPENNRVDDHQVQYFDEDTNINFYEDGTYGWKRAGSSYSERKRLIDNDTSYLIGAKKRKLFVSGVVKGKVLVYSPEKIVIADDLIYAHDPDTTPDADNYLGLVSDKNIEVAGPDITGPGDLSIHASMYAKRRFAVKRYTAPENSLLFVYGSLTAGSLSATEPRFRTKIQFDRRLETKRPPGFPVTNRYEIEPWDAKWRLN